MSARRDVPAPVPSERHSLRPVPSSAAKRSVPPASAKGHGRELAPPGDRSATSPLPAGVPSLDRSSRPLAPSSALK
jgi:hypothetical protein